MTQVLKVFKVEGKWNSEITHTPPNLAFNSLNKRVLDAGALSR